MSNTGMASWIVRIAAILLELILAITVFQLGMRVASGVWGFLLGILGLVALSGVWGVFLSTKSPKRLRPMGRALVSGGILAGVASVVAMTGAPGLGTWLLIGVPVLALCEYSLEPASDSTPMARPYY